MGIEVSALPQYRIDRAEGTLITGWALCHLYQFRYSLARPLFMLKMVLVTGMFCQGPQSSGTTTSPAPFCWTWKTAMGTTEQTAWLCSSIYRGWHGPDWACGLLFADLGLNDKHQIIWVSL